MDNGEGRNEGEVSEETQAGQAEGELNPDEEWNRLEPFEKTLRSWGRIAKESPDYDCWPAPIRGWEVVALMKHIAAKDAEIARLREELISAHGAATDAWRNTAVERARAEQAETALAAANAELEHLREWAARPVKSKWIMQALTGAVARARVRMLERELEALRPRAARLPAKVERTVYETAVELVDAPTARSIAITASNKLFADGTYDALSPLPTQPSTEEEQG
jgi:hypothetical protein